MVKSLKNLPFSIAQKISEEDSIVWLKESNKYIVLDSTILELIKKKGRLSSNDFITLITDSLQVSSTVAIRINRYFRIIDRNEKSSIKNFYKTPRHSKTL